MIFKRCPTPRDGGNARGNVRYILGYQIGGDPEERERANAAFFSLIDQARAREDLGVGTIFRPTEGDGRRPSSVLCLNSASFATFDLECQALAQASPRTRSATHHDIFSFGHDDPSITDEQVFEAVRRVYEDAGLGNAPTMLAVHRDSGSLHVHAAQCSVDPETLRAYPQWRINTRMDRSARRIEIDMLLAHDRGLAKVDYSSGIGVVRDTDKEELRAWARETRGERLLELERIRYSDESRDKTFDRYADARVVPRLRQTLRSALDIGEKPLAIDIVNRAASYGTRIEVEGEGPFSRAFLQDTSGAGRVELTEKFIIELQKNFDDLRVLGDVERAEIDFINRLDADPSLVTRALTQHESTFSRNDVDRFLVDRISDVGESERLHGLIFNSDSSLRLLSPDTADGVWSTKEMLQIERYVSDDARALSRRIDTSFDLARRNNSIMAMEKDRSTPDSSFSLSTEQRDALSHRKNLIVIKGLPGVGKTTVMEAIRRDAEASGRPIVGVTIAQAAAERLETEAGFRSVNSAYAVVNERIGKSIIPRDGILVLDEAGMIDSRTMRTLLSAAREKNTTVIAIGDPRQIPPVGAGGAWHILEREARRAGTYSELTEIRRQEHQWHREAVYEMSHAIDSGRGFEKPLEVLKENNALRLVRDDDVAIGDLVKWHQEQKKISNDVLLVAARRDTVRFLNEEIRRANGLEGRGARYLTDGGVRELATNDRFIFGKNSKNIDVVNGDTGTVTATGKYNIDVRLDRTGQIVSFDSRKYEQWDHGYATTVHRAQGASVRAIGGIVDQTSSAELFHVLASRSKQELRIYAPETSFETVHELADHLQSHVVDKGTTQDIRDEVREFGGPNSYYARSVIAQRLSDANPLRQAYEREVAELRAQRDVEFIRITEQYRQARSKTMDPKTLSDLRSSQRRAEAEITRQHTPENFSAWLKNNKFTESKNEGRIHELRRRREGHERDSDRRRHTMSAERTHRGPADRETDIGIGR